MANYSSFNGHLLHLKFSKAFLKIRDFRAFLVFILIFMKNYIIIKKSFLNLIHFKKLSFKFPELE